jgi:replicative superfamily II helicase
VEPITAALQQTDILLTAETGTGKSLLGTMMIAAKRGEKGVSIYAVPTRALAHQVSDRIVKLAYRGASDKVRVLTMEDEVEAEELAVCKTLVGTYEKIEGLFRENVISSASVNMLVVDECHNISEFSRGVTLDFLLAQTNPRVHCQRLLLSAVMPEDQGKRFAEWAKSKHLMGKDWRRTQLHEKIAFGRIEAELPQEADNDAIAQIVKKLEKHGSERRKVEQFVTEKTIGLIRQGKVVLVTAESRSKVEELADHIATAIASLTTSSLMVDVPLRDRINENRDRLYRYINELKSSELVLPKSTEYMLRLLKQRVVFHHAGLPKSLRRIIEEMIENRIPLVVVSTSTLEAGVNFPVDAAIVKRLVLTKRVKDLRGKAGTQAPFWKYAISRYENMLYSTYRNTIGRAGRAGFAEKGESIFYVDSIDDAQTFLGMRYEKTRLMGEGADLYVVSRLIDLSQPGLRDQLSPISRDLSQSRGRFLSNLLQAVYVSKGAFVDVVCILKKTWLWKILCELMFIEEIDKGFSRLIHSELEELVAMRFVRSGQKGYELTPLGRFVNLSLLNPISAYRIIECLRNIKTRFQTLAEQDIDFCILNAVGMAYEMRTSPFDRPRMLRTEFALNLRDRLRTLGISYDDSSILLAAALHRWIKGYLVDNIIEEFGLHASDHGFLEEIVPKNALWVLHCMRRLAQAIGCSPELVSRIEELTTFVSTGTDNSTATQLIDLQIPGFGRSSVLFLIKSFQLPNASAFAKIGESELKELFPGKEEMACKILKQMAERLT